MNLPANLEPITLNEQTNYSLMEIGKIKDYFDSEITGFDSTDKILTAILIVFSGTNIFTCSCENRQRIVRIDHFSFFFNFLFKFWNN